MTGTSAKTRYERKWIPPLSLAEVLCIVRRHPAGFITSFPGRQVNNVYFDTPALDHYFDHVSGASERMKARVRWYGEFSEFAAKPVLEFKRKRGSASWKESFPFPEIATGRPPAWAPGRWDASGLPEMARLRLQALRPILANHYHRHYFCSSVGGIRLTIDSQLHFLGASAGNHSWREWGCDNPTVVMELKYDDHQSEAAMEISNQIPFRLCRCSKYILGVRQLNHG